MALFPFDGYLRARQAGFALLLLLLLAPHNVLGALKELILRERDRQLEQKLLVDGLQVVEGHAIRIDYGVEYLVQRVQILVQSEFIEQFTETKWGTRSTMQTMPINQTKPSHRECKEC